jgi:hypothetical protein
LTPEDLAAAYKQLLAVERGWRDMKGALGLRPVFHYREDRIRGHVQLCWLALLLIRVVENTTGDTWRNLRHELDRMHLVTLATPEGQTRCSNTTPTHQNCVCAGQRPYSGDRVPIICGSPVRGGVKRPGPRRPLAYVRRRVPCSIRGLGWSISLGVDEHALGAG